MVMNGLEWLYMSYLGLFRDICCPWLYEWLSMMAIWVYEWLPLVIYAWVWGLSTVM